MPGFKPLKRLKRLKPSNSLAAASTKPSGRQPLLHLPAHSPLLLGHSSLPFARLQTLKTLKTLQFPRGSFHQALWPSACAHLPAHSPLLLRHSSLPFARLQTLKTPTLKTLQFHSRQLPPSPLAVSFCCSSIAACPLPAHSALLLGHSSLSCHQALWPSAFAVPGLQPALWLHIPRGSFHQAPGPQRSSIAACPLPAHSALLLGHLSLSCRQALWPSACALWLHIPRGNFHQAPGPQRSSIAAGPLPAHSPLLLGHSSLPFARLQTLKTLKTLQFPRGSFHQALWPSAFAAFACT